MEPNGIECIWIEMVLKQKLVLFGLFYRPHNSNSCYPSTTEDSIHLAVDPGIRDIIITGDFNYNMLKVKTARKIYDTCEELSLINEPTHFTESSSSLIGGARWLSGRVSDSGARGPGFETYRRRVVSLSKTLYSPKVLVNYPGSDGSVPIWLKNCWLGR